MFILVDFGLHHGWFFVCSQFGNPADDQNTNNGGVFIYTEVHLLSLSLFMHYIYGI